MTRPEIPRPTRTPDGFPFPYSHFGDPARRTELLRNIGQTLAIYPDVVVNMGSGYDITPSDAFPEARVIHVDMAPEVVTFLGKAGFEAYEPSDVPAIEADLLISILGPTLHRTDNPRLAPDGIYLTTHTSITPEDMTAVGLMRDPHTRMVTRPEDISELTASGGQMHLAAFKKI